MRTLVIAIFAVLALGAGAAVFMTEGPSVAPAAIAASTAADPATSTPDAARRTMTLRVENMYCASCPYIVKRSLEAVPGVIKASVSLPDKTAIVTFDPSRASVEQLVAATTAAGYPSRPIGD